MQMKECSCMIDECILNAKYNAAILDLSEGKVPQTHTAALFLMQCTLHLTLITNNTQ